MQKTQQIIVILGIFLVVLVGIFPPWNYVDNNNISHPMGYAPIWAPPVLKTQDTADLFGIKFQLNVQSEKANNIDLLRLLLQIGIIFAVTGGSLFLLKRTPV